jgi:hypothetical protein
MAVSRTFTVEFDEGRVGRKRGVGPVSFTVPNRAKPIADVERHVLRAVTPHLASRGVEVEFVLDVETGRGSGVVSAGFREVAAFTIEATS